MSKKINGWKIEQVAGDGSITRLMNEVKTAIKTGVCPCCNASRLVVDDDGLYCPECLWGFGMGAL